MQIIRVQNKDGIGCYSGLMDNETTAMLRSHNNDAIVHPTLHNDKGINRSSKFGEYCGFASWEQFINWFTADEIRAMARNGFYPVMLDVDVTVIGERQCLFRRQDERRYRN